MNSNTLKVQYREDLDILYIRLGSTETSAAFEEYDYVSVFRDWNTHEITGLDVFGFARNLAAGKLPSLPKDLGIEFGNCLK
jgi:hypothetical protein